MTQVKDYFYKVLRKPHITEKTMKLTADNIYTFYVNGTKPQIKKAVAHVYNVNVVDVRTLNYKPEVKMKQKGRSKTKAYKVAYVRLKDGDSIDFEKPSQTTDV